MKKPVTTRYCVVNPHPSPVTGTLRLAFLTDLHGCCSGEETGAIFEILERERPQAVLVGGDMIYGRPGESVEGPVRFMESLAASYPVYSGIGNHELRARIYPEECGTMYRDYLDPVRQAGAVVLENESIEVELAGVPVRITGLDMDREYYGRIPRRKTLPLAVLQSYIGEPGRDRFQILLAHSPAQMETYFAWGADLTLCGHTHGGVARLGAHGGLISPELQLFPRAVYGRFDRGGQTLIIGSGIGEHPVPLRIRNPREVVIIEVAHGREQNQNRITEQETHGD